MAVLGKKIEGSQISDFFGDGKRTDCVRANGLGREMLARDGRDIGRNSQVGTEFTLDWTFKA